MSKHTLKIMVIGAHPDDCELKAGGITALYRQAGHDAHFVSMTNGAAGHHRLPPQELAMVREEEARAVAKMMGLTYTIMPYPDGELQPKLEIRRQLIALIRRENPDLILTHRPWDYHPDHRATAQLVCDAAYMVIVPHVVPEVPALRANPVIMYLSDGFQHPYPFRPDIVIHVEPVLERIIDMLECHRSQFHEWLPYTLQEEAHVPTDSIQRRAYTKTLYEKFLGNLADRCREQIIATYGRADGARLRYVEAFELCEYGAPLTEERKRQLFPMLP